MTASHSVSYRSTSCAILVLAVITASASCRRGGPPQGIRDGSLAIGKDFLTHSVAYQSPTLRTNPGGLFLAPAGNGVASVFLLDRHRCELVDLSVARTIDSWTFNDGGGWVHPIPVMRTDYEEPLFLKSGGGFANIEFVTLPDLWPRYVAGGAYPDFSKSAVVSDTYHDGTPAIVFATADGVKCVTLDGKVVWHSDRQEWYSRVARTPQGSPEQGTIIGLNQKNTVAFFDEAGEIVDSWTASLKLNDIAPVSWMSGSHEWGILAVSAGHNIVFFNASGTVQWTHTLPKEYSLHSLEAVGVSFEEDGEAYVAARLRLPSAWHRSLLCVFDHGGALVFMEVLRSGYGLLAFKEFTRGSSFNECLLVAEQPGKVIRFQLGRKGVMGRKGAEKVKGRF